jgi:hypothetical protein
LLTTLFFVADEHRPGELVAKLSAPLCSGSYIALSQAEPRPQIQRAASAFIQEATEPGIPRTRERIAAFFDGYDLLEPGLVPVSQWPRAVADENTDALWLLGGVGRKP